MNKTEANENYQRLLAEKAELEAWLEQFDAKRDRLRALKPGWHSMGEIEQARRDLRNCDFPIRQESGYSKSFIVAVDEKWICIRGQYDEDKEITRYRRADGGKEKSRGEWNKIDVSKALAIWEAHQSQILTTPQSTQ